jgi:hypothetical protein
MTDLLQKTENVAKNVADENSQDLTEQWRKGELPEGFYFVNDGAEVTIDYYLCDYWERHLDSHIYKVLAEVPDYVEWRNMVNCACEEHEANKRFIEENDKLKELLRECQNMIAFKHEVYEEDALIKEIDEVLK